SRRTLPPCGLHPDRTTGRWSSCSSSLSSLAAGEREGSALRALSHRFEKIPASGDWNHVRRHQVGSRNPDTRFDRVTTLVQYGTVALIVMLLRGLTMPRPIPVPIRQTMFRLW